MTSVKTEPRVALVYDWVNTRYGGAEQVLLQLHQIFPDAPLFTSVYDPHQALWAADFQVKTSFLQSLPMLWRHHRLLAPLMPLAFESLKLKNYDLVLSVTSAEAKGVLTSPDQLHLCYLLTPTRYLWSHQAEYQHSFWTGWLRRMVFAYLKWWDRAAASRPDFIIPISKLVAERTKIFYGRTTLPVIYPPVTFEQGSSLAPDSCDSNVSNALQLPLEFKDYYLVVGRLVKYKKMDLAIRACMQLGRKLLIIGDGPDRGRLLGLASGSPLIHFIKRVSSAELPHYYERCRAFLAPGEEDFGISTLQAQLMGKPVIVYQQSGAAELIKNHQTGIYLVAQNLLELVRCLQELEAATWSPDQIKQRIAGYDEVQFRSQLKATVDKQWWLFEKGKL